MLRYENLTSCSLMGAMFSKGFFKFFLKHPRPNFLFLFLYLLLFKPYFICDVVDHHNELILAVNFNLIFLEPDRSASISLNF